MVGDDVEGPVVVVDAVIPVSEARSTTPPPWLICRSAHQLRGRPRSNNMTGAQRTIDSLLSRILSLRSTIC
jgi:hypothetical protein